MAVVKMHQASDGSLHPTFEAFAKHEEKLKIGKAVETANFDMTAFELDDRDNAVLFPEKIADFIAANADTLRSVLTAGTVSKRGRNKASAA